MNKVDVLIIGAGAAGLMCAIEAGKRGRQVLVIDHANKPGKKIIMSGGGRCNFTNFHTHPSTFISHNLHFCKSALDRYTQWDFIRLVEKYRIPFHEKTLGQLFCDNKSSDIVNMLLQECAEHQVSIKLNTLIINIEKKENGFFVKSDAGDIYCESLVIASGGLSIPTMGASPFGYKVAENFGLKVWPTRAGLVPLTLHVTDKEKLANLAGISLDANVESVRKSFRENILFTHRGLSGPAILQISSYWEPGEEITINMLPEMVDEHLFSIFKENANKKMRNILGDFIPKRVLEIIFDPLILDKTLHQLSKEDLRELVQHLFGWKIKPNGTEGYRTAEVTLGGVDCDELSSKTMEVRKVKGLYFIGEVVDVTGWLGGYNFQWAWSSGWAAGQFV